MQQFVVDKFHGVDSWSTRVLTFDADSRLLLISKRDAPELWSHTVVEVHHVEYERLRIVQPSKVSGTGEAVVQRIFHVRGMCQKSATPSTLQSTSLWTPCLLADPRVYLSKKERLNATFRYAVDANTATLKKALFSVALISPGEPEGLAVNPLSVAAADTDPSLPRAADTHVQPAAHDELRQNRVDAILRGSPDDVAVSGQLCQAQGSVPTSSSQCGASVTNTLSLTPHQSASQPALPLPSHRPHSKCESGALLSSVSLSTSQKSASRSGARFRSPPRGWDQFGGRSCLDTCGVSKPHPVTSFSTLPISAGAATASLVSIWSTHKARTR